MKIILSSILFFIAFGFSEAIATEYTVSGSVFYNDVRLEGNFEGRSDTTGNPGARRTSPAPNYLGALGMTVEIFEVDPLVPPNANCSAAPTFIGSATVNGDGYFKVPIDSVDQCGDGINLIVEVQARFCNLIADDIPDRCIESVDASGNLYQLEWSGASAATPLAATGADIALGSMNFETISPPSPADDWAQVASLYASVIDSTVYAHVTHNIDFNYAGFGQFKLNYPILGGPCNAGAFAMRCPMPTTGGGAPAWVNGRGPFHEYGHTIHARAWDGTLSTCTAAICPGGKYMRNGNASWGATTLEYPSAALMEGFANFFARAAKGTCKGGFDDDVPVGPITIAAAGFVADANGRPEVTTKVLCDWLDEKSEDVTTNPILPPQLPPGTLRPLLSDRLTVSFDELMTSYKSMWDNATPPKVGLDICTFVTSYLEEDNSVANVGQTKHNTRTRKASSILYFNGLDCGYPYP